MQKLATILLAEDNLDDAFLFRRALKKGNITAQVHHAVDGEQAIEYLEGKGEFADRQRFPKPSVILLDIKMPKKSGLEVLEWLAAHAAHRVIPTIIMTSSQLADDIETSYRLGANTFFVKPTCFEDLVELLTTLERYWTTARLPNEN